MKTILVATDFSNAAHNACLYGAELAKAFDARLILVSAYQQVAIPIAETPVIITTEDMKNLVQHRLENEALIINSGNTINIGTCCQNGPASAAILKAAKDKNADIIIVGMKGIGKGVLRFLGSTATALARETKVPLIVIPEEAKYTDIMAIALANESDVESDTDIHLLDSLLEIAQRFHSKLYLVRIAKNSFQKEYELSNRPFYLSRMTRTMAPQYECIEGKDTPRALNEFIAAYRIDMLAMLPRKHSLLDKWLVKSTTRSMVFETHIPLLILPDLYIDTPEYNRPTGLN